MTKERKPLVKLKGETLDVLEGGALISPIFLETIESQPLAQPMTTAEARAILRPAAQQPVVSFPVSFDLQSKRHDLEAEISKLKMQLDAKTRALITKEADEKDKEAQLGERDKIIRQLNEKNDLAHLLNRVKDTAQEKLLESDDFKRLFAPETPCPAYVMSIDIRRSTELMLKAREPKLFAKFIITLCAALRQIILYSYGVFDKFTGDGILAFFPEFYSGMDAGLRTLTAADQCHKLFEAHYHDHRSCFLSVLKDTGLGIGIDYGDVQIVQIGGEFSVVGTPVVYACRMGSATAGQTFLNQPAYEQLFHNYSTYCDFEECDIDIKHEGKTLAYRVKLNGKSFDTPPPDWEETGRDTRVVETPRTE